MDAIVQVYPAPEPDPDRVHVYSYLDSDVMPPVALQPLLGRWVREAPNVPGDMELTIDETGTVERVQLLVPNAYQDRFLIYAVKARQFKPAIKDGRAVRYRLRIRPGA